VAPANHQRKSLFQAASLKQDTVAAAQAKPSKAQKVIWAKLPLTDWKSLIEQFIDLPYFNSSENQWSLKGF